MEWNSKNSLAVQVRSRRSRSLLVGPEYISRIRLPLSFYPHDEDIVLLLIIALLYPVNLGNDATINRRQWRKSYNEIWQT